MGKSWVEKGGGLTHAATPRGYVEERVASAVPRCGLLLSPLAEEHLS